EADTAAHIAAKRYANSSHLTANTFRRALYSLFPLELLGAAVKCFLEKTTRCVLQLALYRWSKRRFALRTIDAPDGYLVQPKLARRFRDNRLDNSDALKATRRTLC